MQSLYVTKIPLSSRAQWALEVALFQLPQKGKCVDGTGLAAMLAETLAEWGAPPGFIKRVFSTAKQLSEKDVELLAAFARELQLDTDVRLEIQPATAEGNTPPLVLEERYFSIWTEKGYGYGTELQYKEKYQNAPTSRRPRVWINLIAGSYSVLLDRKHEPVNLSGNPLKLLCIFLRNFNKRILKQDLEQEMPDYPQVLREIHKTTFGVLRPFMDVEWGTARRLMPYPKGKPRIKLTFCLVDYYKAPGMGEENL